MTGLNIKQTKKVKPYEIFNRAIIETSNDYSVMSMDRGGVIQNWNTAAKKLFGYKEAEAVGKNYSLIFTPEDRDNKVPEKILNETLKNNRAIAERHFIRKNGTIFWASGMIFPIEDKKHGHVGFTKIINDISEQREFEKRRDDFISTATHEIRSPITAIKLFADIVKSKTKNSSNTILNDTVVGLNEQIDRLIALTDYLLDVSKIQGGKLFLRKTLFDMNDLIELVVTAMRLASPKHILTVHSDIKKKVHADKERVGQVLTNLISNAIKYSPKKKGEIIITAKEEKRGITVSVQDYGLGISKDEQSKIFTRFFRADVARKTNITGIGLGLYIAKKIIKEHSGEMGMKSVKGKGSTFYFTIPDDTLIKS